MITYGDLSYEGTLVNLGEGIKNRLFNTKRDLSLDSLRPLLVQVGQLEQAILDEGLPRSLTTLTDVLAQEFIKVWNGQKPNYSKLMEDVQNFLQDLPLKCVKVKVPEGFAFYALFPEQYILAAQEWASRQIEREKVLVIGLRSIGTSLSALVCAALESEGWPVQRLTVRPEGPPFERHVQLNDIEPDIELAIVVDEGPGLSGSSMASVGEALVRAGIHRACIAFLPGHGASPGQAGSEDVQQWWATTPRFVTATSELRWDGQSLKQKLAARTTEILGESVEHIEEVGGGLWRRFVYEDMREFPPVAPAFECPKFLCFAPSGRAVLWKFRGLAVLQSGETGAEFLFRETNRRAQEGWTPPALAMESGFVATPWIGGRVLYRDDVTPQFLNHVGRYLGASAGAPLSPEDQKHSLERMGEWLYWNTWEALGEAMAERTRVWSKRGAEIGDESLYPTYGDGRMAPPKWRQSEDGSYLKFDCCGHDADHTVVGSQTLAWDVAGMIVEWKLETKQTQVLLNALETSCRVTFPGDFLRFHFLGYAAFRLGLLTMGGGSSDGIDFYRTALERWIE